ncbi:hypothetical protein HT031_004664 [Scenedesmus sp. PABB004]|nr:hypothetical protein HT031_004664 [Scenedesmus sp. PABB004]
MRAPVLLAALLAAGAAAQGPRARLSRARGLVGARAGRRPPPTAAPRRPPQYLDDTQPTNELGVVLVPAPESLFAKLRSALAGLGAPSANPGRFEQLSAAAFAGGRGALPGKVVVDGHKGCHRDFEVDSGFGVANVLGPTAGRVGILYLSGEGEFVLRDEATGAEAREAIRPGRFLSWANTGNAHCVVTDSAAPRRFIGPFVLDAAKAGLIPVVDILLPGPTVTPCSAAGACAGNATCVDGLCCTRAGEPLTPLMCCPGALRFDPVGKCCYPIGAAASSASQCCTGKMVENTCAPPTQPRCMSACKNDAHDYAAWARGRCRSGTCEEFAAAAEHNYLAFCAAAGLPKKC